MAHSWSLPSGHKRAEAVATAQAATEAATKEHDEAKQALAENRQELQQARSFPSTRIHGSFEDWFA